MIDPDKRNAIFQLHTEGMSLREISRRLHVSRSAVRAIVKQRGKIDRQPRSDKKQIDAELLERLYRECDGWMQRIHEKLVEEEGVEVGYSTLTRLLRDMGLSGNRSTIPIARRATNGVSGVWKRTSSVAAASTAWKTSTSKLSSGPPNGWNSGR